MLRSIAALGLFALTTTHAHSETTGTRETRQVSLRIAEEIRSNNQFPITIDTMSLIKSKKMRGDGSDLRLYKGCDTSNPLPIWIDPDTINTRETKVWTKGAFEVGTRFVTFAFGDSTAPHTSDPFSVFDATGTVDAQETSKLGSATNQVMFDSVGSQPKSQRGFRFAPKEDLIMVKLGRREPNGSPRVVSLFDFESQKLLRQQTVYGDAGGYSYDRVSPLFLAKGTSYVLEQYQAEGDSYYFFTSTALNEKLFYQDVRYCNQCEANSFPTEKTHNFHYGTADFLFLTMKTPAVLPSVIATLPKGGRCE